jgi:hypothetical protein
MIGSLLPYTDHSIRSRVGNSIPATVTGFARDLLDNARPLGKILNGLDFPMWKDSQWDRSSYATDMVAWDYLHGDPHCGTATTPYPTGHVQWGLAGTAHTVSMFNINSDGFATFLQVMCGKKLWAVYHPSPGLPLSNINAFTDSNFFELDSIPSKAQFGLEAVVLRPGDSLHVSSHFIYFFLIFLQVDATWGTPLRVWPRERHSPWWSFLLFVFNASNLGKLGTQLCPQRLHIQHVSSSFLSIIATHCNFLGACTTRESPDFSG